MNAFSWHQPTELVFGAGRIQEIGRLAARFGRRILLVTGPTSGSVSVILDRVLALLRSGGLEVAHFDGVVPNPTTDIVTVGAGLARESGAEVVVGLGGGSSMDVAKAIAVEASHPGTAWDYLYYKTPPTSATLPVIAVTTTSGTGSHVTQCSVITRTEDQDKSALWHANLFPRVALVDPELMLALPRRVTAHTGFDAFCHSFEAYISNAANPYSEMLALEAIRLISQNLRRVLDNGSDLAARSAMAWADTLAGLAISSAGVTLPHGLGMQISGHCPRVTHGQSLAVTYPAFTRFTWQSAVPKFATVGRILNPALDSQPDHEAASQTCGEIDLFLREIDLWIGFRDLNVTRDEIVTIAAAGQVLPDYKNNPRVASLDEMISLMLDCFER